MTYNECVRAIAEESIQSFIYECQKEDNTFALIGADKENLLQLFLPAARIVVKHMAEAAKDFHYAAWTSRAAYDAPADGARAGQLEYLLQQKGLIPDQEHEKIEYDPSGKIHNPDNPAPDQEAGEDEKAK